MKVFNRYLLSLLISTVSLSVYAGQEEPDPLTFKDKVSDGYEQKLNLNKNTKNSEKDISEIEDDLSDMPPEFKTTSAVNKRIEGSHDTTVIQDETSLLSAKLAREKKYVEYLKKKNEALKLERKLNSPGAVLAADSYGIPGLHAVKTWGARGNESALLYVNKRYVKAKKGTRVTPTISIAKINATDVVFNMNGKLVRLGLSSEDAIKSDESESSDENKDTVLPHAIPVPNGLQ